MSVSGLRKASVLDSHLLENHSSTSRRFGSKERPTTRTSSIRKMWRDLENKGRVVENMESEEDTSIDGNEIENQIPLQNGQEDENKSRCHRSPSFDTPEKERVRKIFHEWGSKSYGENHTLYSSRMNNCSRAQWLGENECKRVRIVREWIESSTQQRDTCRTEIGSQIERVRDESESVVDCVNMQRPIRRIYGRQALLDLLSKFKQKREKEIQDLLKYRFVSNFTHRHRIQSLLKGRFLWNQRFVKNDKQTSVAASELGLLRQTHSVSDLRKGFLSRLNKCDHMEQAEEIVQDIPHEEISEEFVTTSLTRNWESQNPQQFNQYNEKDKPPVDVHVPECNQSDSDTLSDNEMTFDQLVPEITDETVEDEGINVNLNENEHEWYEDTLTSDLQESHEEWYENDATESLFGENSYQLAAPVPRSIVFDWSDEDNNNNNNSRRFELTELSNRRRVSNLLESDFSTRLEHLIQSYINRQEQQSVDENADDNVTAEDVHETQSEIINGLRIDMDTLQQRMDDIQRMLETCINMQLDLQKLVKQEVYSALNGSLNSGCLNHDSESTSGKGVCYLCCDNGFQSLPDRCVHMYICSKCSEKVNWSKLKESMMHP